jgi:hypothetical protein
MSVFPVCRKTQTPLENSENLVNQHYVGYTFKHTVKQHLEESKRAFEKAEKSLNRLITNAQTKEAKDHWIEAMKCFKSFGEPKPHPCNKDYTIYMASQLTLEEIINDTDYDSLTIRDISNLSLYISEKHK